MKKIFVALIVISIISCNSSQTNEQDRLEYKRWVGDIEHSESLDATEFELCNEDSKVYQYFNDGNGLEYEGEKIAIIDSFQSQYQESQKGESGYIRIRFIVNCNGETGRFRILGMDEDYELRHFHKSISNALLKITKSLNNWKPKLINNQPIDYYQHLIFKIKDGKILEILP